MTVAEQLAARALAPPSSEAIGRLRVLTLTNIAAGLGEFGSARRLIDDLPLDDGRAGDAAFRHGMRLHARTQDDFHPSGRVHVGAVTLAATLALAEYAGTRLFECLSAGYEAMCALAVVYAGDAQRRGYRPSGIFGPVGAAASAAVALGLDQEGVANALALAAARSGGTNQSWVSGTDEWLLEVGSAARSGVEAALFTAAGATGALEAFDGAAGWARAFFADATAERLAPALTAEPYVPGVAVKPYPVSGIAQVPTHLGCRAHNQLDGRRLSGAVVRMSASEASYPGSANRGPFRSRSDALMSVCFCTAAGIRDGAVGLGRLEAPNELAGVFKLVAVEPDAAIPEGTARLVLDFGSGEAELTASSSELLFPSWNSLAWNAVGLASRTEADPEMVEEAVGRLSSERPDARELDALLKGTV
jgi:hypothetical protein